MLRQARSVGLKTQFMGPEGVGNASLSNIAGDAAEGMLVTMPKRYDQDPTNQGIVDALKADKKDPSGPYVWITYAAVQSLATALERTGSDEPLALVKDLKANGANTVIGPLNWDEKAILRDSILVSSSGTPTVHPRQPSDHPTVREKRAGLERLPYV